MSSPIAWPEGGAVTPEWAQRLASSLEANTRGGDPPSSLARVFPRATHDALFDACGAILESEPTLLKLEPGPGVRVVVVGDTHGQLHDALKLIQLAGEPSPTNWFVFNGDFVDRGAWGAELFAVAMSWKVAAPRHVFLLRGNHECEFCTEVYGYKRELQVKYGKAAGNALWRKFMRVGAALPLAAQIGAKTLVLHGGLFRGRPRPKNKGAKKKLGAKFKRLAAAADAAADGTLSPGTLADLAAASKGGPDPDGEGAAQIAGDVLWSDPAGPDEGVPNEGMIPNENRGIGTMFGVAATGTFLRENGLALVLRSHEGPDAREDRAGMDPMKSGFSVDHEIEGVGKLCTVFSAPDYPQFVEEGEVRHENDASFVILEDATEWAEPRPVRFAAERPRPRSRPYYDVTVGGSDEEGPDGELARAVKRDEGEREDEDEKEKPAGGEGEEGEEDPANEDPANEDPANEDPSSGASGEGGAPRVRAS